MREALNQFYAQLDDRYARGDLTQVEHFLQSCLKQAADPESVIAICNEQGALYRGDGRYRLSLSSFERARLAAAESVGAEDCAYATILNNMAGTCRLMGDHAAAIRLFENALAIYRRAGRQGGCACASILNNLSLTYREAGRLTEAIACLEAALADMEQQPGRRPDVAIAYNNLTELYHAVGSEDEAMRCLNCALTAFESCADVENRHYAAGLNSLAGFLFSAGRHEQALDLYQKSARYTMRFFGETVEYGITCQNMRWVYEQLGRRREAARVLETAARIYKRLLGEDHERTRAAREALRRLPVAPGG